MKKVMIEPEFFFEIDGRTSVRRKTVKGIFDILSYSRNHDMKYCQLYMDTPMAAYKIPVDLYLERIGVGKKSTCRILSKMSDEIVSDIECWVKRYSS